MVTREEKITQSIEDYVRGMLFGSFAYPADKVELLDAYPTNRFDRALDKSYVAIGFNFDDGGQGGELGSDLVHRVYTVELWTFGMSPVWGRNIANAVKAALEQESSIPLRDYGSEDTDPSDATKPPIIDALVIPPRGLRARHVPVRDPRPWEENVHVVTVNLEDWYNAELR